MQSTGYAVRTGPDGIVERDTITCAHCQRIVFLKPGVGPVKHDPGGFCLKCSANICGPCADEGVCTPFEKQLELMERGILQSLRRDDVLAALGLK